MQIWHLLILGHVAAMSIGQYFGKIFVHKIHPYQILFYQYIASIATISIYLAVLKPDAKFGDATFWFLGIGFMYAFGISATYHSKKQSLSKTTVTKKMSDLIPIFLAILFLGEHQILSTSTPGGIKKIIGLILAITATLLFYQKNTHRGSEKSFNYLKWIKWITIAIVVQGFAKFIVKFAVDHNEPLQVLQLQYIGSFITITLLALFSKKNLTIGWKNSIGSLGIGILISTSLAALYTALSLSTATQVFSLVSIGTLVVISSIGIFVFKEKFTKKMILPFILALIAIYLLK